MAPPAPLGDLDLERTHPPLISTGEPLMNSFRKICLILALGFAGSFALGMLR